MFRQNRFLLSLLIGGANVVVIGLLFPPSVNLRETSTGSHARSTRQLGTLQFRRFVKTGDVTVVELCLRNTSSQPIVVHGIGGSTRVLVSFRFAGKWYYQSGALDCGLGMEERQINPGESLVIKDGFAPSWDEPFYPYEESASAEPLSFNSVEQFDSLRFGVWYQKQPEDSIIPRDIWTEPVTVDSR